MSFVVKIKLATDIHIMALSSKSRNSRSVLSGSRKGKQNKEKKILFIIMSYTIFISQCLGLLLLSFTMLLVTNQINNKCQLLPPKNLFLMFLNIETSLYWTHVIVSSHTLT